MSKHELKLTSIRMDKRILKKCDDYVRNRLFMTRSDLINKLLLAVLLNFDEDQLNEMCNYLQWQRYEVETEFKTTTEERTKAL